MNLVLWFKNYLRHTETYSTWRFILEFGLILNAVKIFYIAIIITLVSLVGYRSPERTYPTEQSKVFIPMQENLVSFDSIYWIIFLVLIGPLLETFVAQIIPISLTSRFVTKHRVVALVVSTVLFVFMHENDMVLRLTTIVPGIVLAWSYMVHGKKSFWQGVWVTTLLHSTYNLLAIIINLI